jgi:hypothetical protein
MLNTFGSARLNSSLPNKKEILLNVLTASAMATQKLLSSKTQMHKVHRLPLYNSMRTQGKIKWCPLCPLWKKPSCQLQGLHGIQGPQQKTFPPLRPKIYTSPPHLKQTLHTQSGVTYSQITKHNSSAPLILMMNPTSALHFCTIVPNSPLHNKVMTFKSSKRWWKASSTNWDQC